MKETTQEFYIGQKFEGTYPPQAAMWCNEKENCYITEIELEQEIEGKTITVQAYQIVEVPQPTAEELQANFEDKFINTAWGWYRKQPQGYANAPQSVDIILNMVNALGGFTEQIANLMIFYTQPDFTKPEQCTEEWLIANQYKHEATTKQEFMQFYVDFQTRWATEQYSN